MTQQESHNTTWFKISPKPGDLVVNSQIKMYFFCVEQHRRWNWYNFMQREHQIWIDQNYWHFPFNRVSPLGIPVVNSWHRYTKEWTFLNLNLLRIWFLLCQQHLLLMLQWKWKKHHAFIPFEKVLSILFCPCLGLCVEWDQTLLFSSAFCVLFQCKQKKWAFKYQNIRRSDVLSERSAEVPCQCFLAVSVPKASGSGTQRSAHWNLF